MITNKQKKMKEEATQKIHQAKTRMEAEKEPDITGAIKPAQQVADALLLQYYEEPDVVKAAFGHDLSDEDWAEFEYGDEEKTYFDINGVELDVSDEVKWHDEAGVDENGDDIIFTIVEERGDGYFNLSYGDEDENPDRWAYYTELEIV